MLGTLHYLFYPLFNSMLEYLPTLGFVDFSFCIHFLFLFNQTYNSSHNIGCIDTHIPLVATTHCQHLDLTCTILIPGSSMSLDLTITPTISVPLTIGQEPKPQTPVCLRLTIIHISPYKVYTTGLWCAVNSKPLLCPSALEFSHSIVKNWIHSIMLQNILAENEAFMTYETIDCDGIHLATLWRVYHNCHSLV